MKSPPGKELAALGDEGLTRALADLVELARTHKADRVMMDDFSAFVQFRVFDSFAAALRRLVLDAAAIETTFVLGLGEPANEASTNLLRFVEGEVAGTIHATADFADQAQFELHAGTAHTRDVDVQASTFTESTQASDESEELDPWLQPQDLASSARDVSAAHAQENSPQPPFELSIPVPNGGGDGANKIADIADLAVAPPGLERPSIGPTSPAIPDTSGDTAWATITPISFEDPPFISKGPVSFLTGSPDLGDIGKLGEIGYYVDSAGPEAAPPTQTSDAPPDLEKAAAEVHKAAYPELFRPIEKADSSGNFKQALAEAFAQRETTPFLVMALRIPADDPYANVFSAVTEGVRIGIGQSAAMLTESGRLIALIPNADADIARNVFAILKAHLKMIVPDRADAALQHVNAMAVPNGEPFKTSDELFAYAFGG